MRQHDFRSPIGNWESMFVPNGSGTVEWRLGWGIEIPERYFLMIIGAGLAGLEIPLGVVAADTVNAMTARGGFSIAVHPAGVAHIQRGDPIARLVLLHPDSLQAHAERASNIS
jgi:hypothetical protein